MKKIILLMTLTLIGLKSNAQHHTIGLNYSLGFNPTGDQFTYDNTDIGNYSLGWYPVPGSAEARLSGYGGIQFFTHTGLRLTITQSGNVGIGTSNPETKIESSGAITINPSASNKNYLMFKNNNERLGIIGSDGSISGGNQNNLGMYVYGNNDLEFWTNSGKRMVLKGDGNIGIGTSTPDSKLTVKGLIHSREVKVTAIAGGADFVFESEYDLPTLEKVESYIKKNKHLPEIASAKDMEKDGIHLADMNIKLLQKIEELTLYTINQQKEINKQKKQIKTLISVTERLTRIEEKLKKEN